MEFVNEMIVRAQTLIVSARTRQEGQTLVEYALILALVSITAFVALQTLSGKINGIFNTISSTL